MGVLPRGLGLGFLTNCNVGWQFGMLALRESMAPESKTHGTRATCVARWCLRLMWDECRCLNKNVNGI